MQQARVPLEMVRSLEALATMFAYIGLDTFMPKLVYGEVVFVFRAILALFTAKGLFICVDDLVFEHQSF